MYKQGWMDRVDMHDLGVILNIATMYCNKAPDVIRDIVIGLNRLRKEIEKDVIDRRGDNKEDGAV